jgi:hypothetical protein
MRNDRRSLAALPRWLRVLVPLCVGLLPGLSMARVDPLYLITRQIQKPNVLIILDTSSSMGHVPGQEDVEWAEAGPDCDNGDRYCRMIGTPGRCFYTAGGRMGAGVTEDTLPCTTDAQCEVAYCGGGTAAYGPAGCTSDADADDISNGATCKGVCSHDKTTACSKNSDCGGSGRTCMGRVYGGANPGEGYPTLCTAGGGECSYANACHAYQIPGRNFCVPAGSATTMVKMCRLQGSLCRLDADCSAVTGDTCGPASSRLVIAKRVLDNVVNDYYQSLNFGFMTFINGDPRDDGKYFPYFDIGSNPITSETVTTLLSREQLEAQNCFATATGPAASCTIHGITYTRKAAPNSRYRINKGTTFAYQDATWGTPATCLKECVLSGVGTGIYQGTYYTWTNYTSTPTSGSWDGDHVSWRPSDYTTKVRTSGSNKYMYMEAPTTRRNLGGIMKKTYSDPIEGGWGSTCTSTSGGLWDANRWPFMDTSASLPAANATTMLNAISRQLRKASQGGIYAAGGTPTACTLKNGVGSGDTSAEDPKYSAYHYLQKVKADNATNNVSCRPNYVLFVTDGYPGGDLGCNSSDCRMNPVGAGCSSCRSIAAARSLYKDLGVKVLAVGFSNAVTTGAGRDFLNNLAYVGGTDHALFANNEDDLRKAIDKALYDSLSGSYATSPVTAGGSEQTATGGQVANWILDSRADFPTWKGHLIAYDVSSGTPVLKWDAATGFDATADPDFWKKRNVWTSKGKTMIKIQVATDGTITNAADLADPALALGATADEAALVARWMLGDPALGNNAVLGAIVNSSAIEMGGIGQTSLTFVGASDGMLHAFHSRDQKIGVNSYLGGREAFAYIPQDMLKVIRRLYAQGGQKPAPKDHIFGLANSPKLKRICTADCANPGYETWKTMLVMSEGYGGSDMFVLDVTAPFGPTGPRSAPTDPPVQLQWHSEYLVDSSSATAYNNDLGKTISLPGFYFAKSATLDDNRMIFASGYTDVANSKQGMVLMSANAVTGQVKREDDLTSLAGSCPKTTELTVLADVAVARRWGLTTKDRIAAAYVGDTCGNLYRFDPAADDSGNLLNTATINTVDTFGSTNPLHLAPTLVQLDRYDATKDPGHIYIVQLTNSAYDPVTFAVSSAAPASQLIIRRDIVKSGGSINPDSGWVVSPDTDWGDNKDRVSLSVTNAGQICAVWNTTTKTCTTAMPSSARPLASSTGILRADYNSFALVTLWYVPDAGGCTKGKTYLTIHEVTPSGIATQRHGELVGDEPVLGAVFVAGKLMIARSDGARVITTPGLAQANAVVPPGVTTTYLYDRYRSMGWIEVP